LKEKENKGPLLSFPRKGGGEGGGYYKNASLKKTSDLLTYFRTVLKKLTFHLAGHQNKKVVAPWNAFQKGHQFYK
jgi:hypothetical protein